MASVRTCMKQGTANLAEDYCFIQRHCGQSARHGGKLAVPPSNSRPDELNSKANKHRFIRCSEGIVDHGNSDAAVIIVETAVQFARHKYTVLIVDDTDLLNWMHMRHS